ncbi:MAG: DUF6514 family protein [Defluviitaleaceae bacterium]|nr:DUF6514 family protein [Defluviitaleaceae bacterium]
MKMMELMKLEMVEITKEKETESIKEENIAYVRYSVMPGFGFLEDFGEYRTYGLKGEAFSGKNLKATRVINDVTQDPMRISAMAELFERRQLSLIHLEDVVIDMISV